MKTLGNLQNIEGKRVLLRLDLNVPIENNEVTDDFRLQKSIPTIQYLVNKGVSLVIISHRSDDRGSLLPIAKLLDKIIPTQFVSDTDITNETIELSKKIPVGSAILLENLRMNPGEKTNDMEYANRLSQLGDAYVLDAFAVMHRVHASVVTVPTLMESCAGLLVEDEVTNLKKVHDPDHPFVFILGGAKSSTKQPLMKKFINIADILFVGGALANDFYAAKGYEVGNSMVDADADVSEFIDHERILLPRDVVIDDKKVVLPDEVLPNQTIYDAGPESIIELKKLINDARFILWNGPLGAFENGYIEGTLELAKAIALSSAYSVIGGGDSIASIQKLKNLEKFNFVSTGGGAMLDFLADGRLPGVDALS